jgi:hypothetical protein
MTEYSIGTTNQIKHSNSTKSYGYSSTKHELSSGPEETSQIFHMGLNYLE